MNIKQAKARFTELTGLPAKDKAVFQAIWDGKGYVADWVMYAYTKWDGEDRLTDLRTTKAWVLLVEYLESLEEVA